MSSRRRAMLIAAALATLVSPFMKWASFRVPNPAQYHVNALMGNALELDDLRLVMTGWSGDVGFLPNWVVICVVMLSVLVTAIVRRRVVTVPLSAIGLALVVSEMFFIGFTKGVVLGPGLPILALSATFALGAAVEPAMRLRAMAQAVTRAVVSST